jgi:hypothetical protein
MSRLVFVEKKLVDQKKPSVYFMLFYYLVYSSILKMEALCCSETLVDFYHTT